MKRKRLSVMKASLASEKMFDHRLKRLLLINLCKSFNLWQIIKL
jgi:hypothetical protein